MVFKKKHKKHQEKKFKRHLKLKKNMKENKTTTSLSEFKDKHIGKEGTATRKEHDEGYQAFKIGVLLQTARQEKGLTQEELAAKCGTTKSYISKIENDIKEVRISTLQKIVELGLGGKLNLSIKLD
jgi:ribosome-binding protein aMBF1 (putative translation factor)